MTIGYEGYPKKPQHWFYAAVWAALAGVKNAVVSDTPRYLKVRAGPARGAMLFTTYRCGTRQLLGVYESEIIPYLKRYVRAGDVCYDIGAAGGYYTFAFAKLAAPGRVHSFDMDKQLTDQLTVLADDNARLGSMVRVHQMQIGARHVDERQTSLDQLVYQHRWPPPDVIKIDVEGGELDILNGAAQLLREHHPRLIVEVHSVALEQSCTHRLESLSYTPTLVKNRAWMAEYMSRRSHNRWLCAD